VQRRLSDLRKLFTEGRDIAELKTQVSQAKRCHSICLIAERLKEAKSEGLPGQEARLSNDARARIVGCRYHRTFFFRDSFFFFFVFLIPYQATQADISSARILKEGYLTKLGRIFICRLPYLRRNYGITMLY
jgi:hypothetical protein